MRQTKRTPPTLRPDYFIDDLVKASEQGALGAGSSDVVVRTNEAPHLSVDGDEHLTTRVGEPIALVAVAMDDGIPKTSSRTSSLRSAGTDSTAHPEWTPSVSLAVERERP